MSSSEAAAPSPGKVAQDYQLATDLAPETADVESLAAGVASPQAVVPARVRVSSPGRDAIRRFRRNHAAMISLVAILILVVLAIFAPFMHTMNPLAQTGLYDQSPSGNHWMGTDALGEDTYSRLLYGLRTPLFVGFFGTLITVGMGTLIGVSAGYFGGIFDNLMSRVTDLMFAFPGFLAALLTVSLFGPAFDNLPLLGGSGRVILLTAVFSIVAWPGLMRFVRSLGLSMREQQFVEAAKTSGSSSWRIIRRHLLPNMYGLILVQAALIMVGIIYTEVSLTIFGLGVPAPAPDVGTMLYNGTTYLDVDAAQVIFPGLALAIMLVAMTFVGDGVRDAVDPRMNS